MVISGIKNYILNYNFEYFSMTNTTSMSGKYGAKSTIDADHIVHCWAAYNAQWSPSLAEYAPTLTLMVGMLIHNSQKDNFIYYFLFLKFLLA